MGSKELPERSQLLRTISHPTRLMILTELAKGVKCVIAIQELLSVSQPNVSQHLTVLKDGGLVASCKDGVSRCYYLVKPGMVKALLRVLDRDYPTAAPPKKGVCPARRKKTGRARGACRKCRKRRSYSEASTAREAC